MSDSLRPHELQHTRPPCPSPTPGIYPNLYQYPNKIMEVKAPLLLFSRSAVSDALCLHGLQHARLLCPSPSPGGSSNLCPLSWRCHPTVSSSVSPSPPAFNLPSIRVFSNESVLCIRWPKYWSFNFSISPSNEYSGLISFRIDWFDLLAVQGTLKSLLQNHSLKASILWHSVFFMVQFSHPYMTTGKTTWTFVGKVMSLHL